MTYTLKQRWLYALILLGSLIVVLLIVSAGAGR